MGGFDSQNPFLRTLTSHSNRDISFRRLIVYRLSVGTVSEKGHGTHGSGLDKSGDDTADRHDEDCHCVIIILVHGPQYQTGNLKDVERVEDLAKVNRVAKDFRRNQQSIPRRRAV